MNKNKNSQINSLLFFNDLIDSDFYKVLNKSIFFFSDCAQKWRRIDGIAT